MIKISFKKSLYVLMLILCCLTHHAFSEPVHASFKPLKNDIILKLLQKAYPENTHFYVPFAKDEAQEEDYLNQDTAYLGVIAAHNHKLTMLILQKEQGQWHVFNANDKALVRQGFELTAFTVEYKYNAPIFSFVFKDPHQRPLELYLRLFFDTEIPCYIIKNDLPEYSAHFMGDQYTLYAEKWVDFKYMIHFDDLKLSDGFNGEYDAFSFSDAPLSFEDIMKKARITPKDGVAKLYTRIDKTLKPILTLSEGDIKVIEFWEPENSPWSIAVFKGHYLLISKDDYTLVP